MKRDNQEIDKWCPGRDSNSLTARPIRQFVEAGQIYSLLPLPGQCMEALAGIEPAFLTHLFYLCKGGQWSFTGVQPEDITQTFIDSIIVGVKGIAVSNS